MTPDPSALTPERIKEIETRWKSDVDLKLDRLVAFANSYEPFLALLLEREQSKAAFRKAVMEKTTVGLLMAAVALAANGLWEGVQQWIRNLK